MVLASAADKRLSQLAELADSTCIYWRSLRRPSRADIAGRAPTTAVHDIRVQISRLADTVAAMQARIIFEERQRPSAEQIMCRYNPKHGNAARKCIPFATMRET
ncbi:hypothetical protein MRX96_057329 [Rhipicephalus microplus]